MSVSKLGSLGLISQYSDSEPEDFNDEGKPLENDAVTAPLKPPLTTKTAENSSFSEFSKMPTPTFSSLTEQTIEMTHDECEPEVVTVGVVVKGSRVREGESYVQFRIKEEPLSDNGTEDSEPDSGSSSDDEKKERNGTKIVKKKKSKKKKSSDSSDSEDWDDDDGKKPKPPPKAKGEMGFQDLPPIEDLHISVPHEQTRPIGIIRSVVDPLVVVEALPNNPALDIDSILFLDEGDRVLGAIFDVIGQVKQPFYCVRFNSLEHIESRGVVKGMPVYCAPATPHTSYVLVAQLQKFKGTDASWRDDVEPPPEIQEFSDDEAERSVKKGKKKKNPNFPSTSDGNVLPQNGPGVGPNPRFRAQLHRPRYSRGIHQRFPYNNRAPGNQQQAYHQQQSYYPPPPPPPHPSDISWHNHPALVNQHPHPYQNFPHDPSQNFQYQRPPPPPNHSHQNGPVAYSSITARNCWPHPHGPFIGPPRWNPGSGGQWTNPNAPAPPPHPRNQQQQQQHAPPPPPPGC